MKAFTKQSAWTVVVDAPQNNKQRRTAAPRCQGITQFGTQCAQKTRNKDRMCHHHRKRPIAVATVVAADKQSTAKTVQKNQQDGADVEAKGKELDVKQIQLEFDDLDNDGPKERAEVNKHDIDVDDFDNQFACAEYANDIFRNLRHSETRYKVAPTFLSSQTEINSKMRSILIDWLVEIHLKFKLRPETLFLGVNLLDRFLEKQKVARNKLQLVGVTCMMLAAKYEEIYPPEVRDWIYICDSAYTRNQILQMEPLVLNRLGFRLAAVTPFAFVRRFSKAAGHQDEQTFFDAVMYLLTAAQLDVQALEFTPSMLTAASVSLTLEHTDGCLLGWTETLTEHTSYVEKDLEQAKTFLLALAHKQKEDPLQATWKKFSMTKYNSVASQFVADQ